MIGPLQHLLLILAAWVLCQAFKSRQSVHVLTAAGLIVACVFAPYAGFVISLTVLQGIICVWLLKPLPRASNIRKYAPYLLLLNLFWVDLDDLMLGISVATLGISFSTIRIFMTAKQILSARIPPKQTDVYWIAVAGFYLPALVIGPVFSGLTLKQQYEAGAEVKTEIRDYRMILQGLVLAILASPFLGLIADKFSYHSTILTMPFLFLQLFAAFWGQSLIAEHSSRFFGYTLPVNFNHPWKATTPKDFWARWHTSMAQFVLQYIFLPLNLAGVSPKLATIGAFVFMGIWHNLSLGYLVWGLCHGIMLAYSPSTPPEGARGMALRIGIWIAVISLSYVANYGVLS